MASDTRSASTLNRNLTLISMAMAVITTTIGSGWLLAPYFSDKIAGPASLIRWLLAGTMVFPLSLVLAEFGALIIALSMGPVSL